MRIRANYRFILVVMMLSHVSCGLLSENLRQENDNSLDVIRGQKSEADNIREGQENLKIEKNLVSNTTESFPEKKWLYKKGSRATREDFIDDSQDEGSLWASSGQTNYYFTKNRVKNPGELITVTIEPELYRDICLEVRNSLNQSEKEMEIGALKEQLRAKLAHSPELDTLNLTAAAPERSTASSSPAPSPSSSPSPHPSPSSVVTIAPRSPEEIERTVSRLSIADVNIQPSLDLKSGDSLTGEIIERFPNGNFKIRVMKRVPYKKGRPQLVSLVGVIKSVDLNEDTDVVSSGKLYDYHLEVSH